ncbi:MAG: phosphoglycerate kinase [Candidatus Buchananbacteria bacterium]|nr:phosphoglycerate kinase [Candidatus Buchananbacteria bacterium]
MKLKSIKQVKNLKNKKVLVRVDYNVAMEKGNVLDTERIERSYATINYLLKNKAKIILMAHLGRPKGEKDKDLSLKFVLKYLNQVTKKKVKFVDDCIGEKVNKQVSRLKAGQILLLENLRFYPGEKNNDAKFAQSLAELADIYVNEAFANCHREHASIAAITKYLPAYAGLNLIDEVNNLEKALKGYDKPAIAIIGGVKVETKIKVIEKFLKKYNYVLIGGALANNFFAGQNIKLGKSVYNKEDVKLAEQLYDKYKSKIILPIDVRTAKRLSPKSKVEAHDIFNLNKLKDKNWQIVDIGPKTEIYFEHFIHNAKTIVWNGPMGVFEIEAFSHGTEYIAQKFAAQAKGPAFGIVGGGETLVVINKLGLSKWPDFVSTGGGAMLNFLEGKTLPGIKPLIKR